MPELVRIGKGDTHVITLRSKARTVTRARLWVLLDGNVVQRFTSEAVAPDASAWTLNVPITVAAGDSTFAPELTAAMTQAMAPGRLSLLYQELST